MGKVSGYLWICFSRIDGRLRNFYVICFANMMGTMSKYDSTYSTNSLKNIMGAGMIIFYIVCAVIAFFPYYFLLRFANKMKAALVSNDQDSLNGSFQNLKILYRYMGILMIISLAFMIFAILAIAATTIMAGGS